MYDANGILSLLSLIQLVRGIPTIPITQPPSFIIPPPSTEALNVTAGNGNCASSYQYPSWGASDWVIEDCYSALNQLYIDEVLPHPDNRYEFIARGAQATRPKLTVQRTPRKYVVGTCVLTIMMLEWFQPGQLPGCKGYSWPKTDVGTYRRIYMAAKRTETQCTEARTPGWAITGDELSMGVFVWATGSQINEMTGGFPVLTSATSFNFSEIALPDSG